MPMLGLNGRYYTNDHILLGSETCERISSPANTRKTTQKIFNVPPHTIGSKNLFIYVDGKLLIPEVDYEDANSGQVELKKPIGTEIDFDSVLVSGNLEGSHGMSGGYWGSF